MARRLGAGALLSWLVTLPIAMAQLDDSRVALLPTDLPSIPGVAPLDQARAQALATFLTAHRLFGDGACDPMWDLCLPALEPVEAASPQDLLQGPLQGPPQGPLPGLFPTDVHPVLYPPVEGPLLQDFAATSTGPTPSYGLIYLAPAGALIRAPFAGEVQLVQRLSAGRTQLSLAHPGGDGRVQLSVLTGQIDSDVAPGDTLVAGQPFARARPRRDSTTRLIFNLIVNGQEVDPEPWLQPAALQAQSRER